MRITNKRNGRVVSEETVVARSLLSRLIGLMWRAEFKDGSALVIPGCRQVHTFFVRFPIDLIFLDRRSGVVRTVECLKPFDISSYCWAAAQTIELPAGTLSKCDVREGDKLLVEDKE